jgi:hypothetical protein
LPNLPDTVIRVEGTTLRADIGRPTAWRLSFHGDSLFRVERVQGDRVAEWVARSDPSRIKYRNEGARRTVQLTITRTDEGSEFDAAIWRFDGVSRPVLTGRTYSLAGGGLPPNIQLMAISTFDNQTSSPDVTKELYDQMHASCSESRFRDAPAEKADAAARVIQTYDADVLRSASAPIRSKR